MSSRWIPMLRGIVLCGLVATLPALAQDNGRTRPAPGGQQGGKPPDGGGRPGGGSSGGGRPSPGGGGKPTQPPKPNPGQGGGGRPNPGGGKPNPGGGRPNPGGGNAGRPQPSRPQPGRPQPGRPGNGGRPPSHGRPPNWGRPPQNRPSWSFRPNNRSFLHQYYFRILANVNRANRPVFTVGGFFPYAYIGYLTPVPVSLYSQIPPPPPGYQMGYYDGYVVVYDPVTYYIIDVIDLLQ